MLDCKLHNDVKEMMCCVERNMVQNLVVCDFCINTHTHTHTHTHILANNKVSMQKSYGLLLLRQWPFCVGN